MKLWKHQTLSMLVERLRGEKERYQSKNKSKDISYRIINLKSTIMRRATTNIQQLQCELMKVDE